MSGRIYPRSIMERELARYERRLRGEPEPPRPVPRTYRDVYMGREILVVSPAPGFKLERALEGDGPFLWQSTVPSAFGGVFGRTLNQDEHYQFE